MLQQFYTSDFTPPRWHVPCLSLCRVELKGVPSSVYNVMPLASFRTAVSSDVSALHVQRSLVRSSEMNASHPHRVICGMKQASSLPSCKRHVPIMV